MISYSYIAAPKRVPKRCYLPAITSNWMSLYFLIHIYIIATLYFKLKPVESSNSKMKRPCTADQSKLTDWNDNDGMDFSEPE